MSATDNRSPLGDTVTNWLHHLYGHAEAGWLTLFSVDATTGDRFADWAPIIDTSDAVAHATTRATTCDVWFGVATRTEPLGANRRGGGPDCAGLPGLWLDIDIVGPGHRQGGRLATDEPAARALLDAFPLPATAVVHSGGGLQAWWLFAEMVPVDDQALTLLAAWGTTWSRIADAQGIDIDNVLDVARVMRLPGTTNRKEGGARPVTVTDAATGNTLKPDSTGVVTLGTWSAPTSGSTFGVTSGGIPGQPMHPVVSPEQFGALVATVDALKADAAAAKVASDRDAKVRTLVAGLAAEGFAVPADAEATLVKMAADQGMAAVDAYAVAWRKHGRKAPPSSIEGAIEAPHHPELTKAFEKYGPAVEPHVARFSAAFDELKGASRLDRETFVLRNLQSLRLIKE